MKLHQTATSSSDVIEVYEDLDLMKIIEKYVKNPAGRTNADDGFYVFNLDNVVDKHRRWQRNFPRIFPHYAMKCNSNPILLKILVALGNGFDCASKIEIQQILSLGVSPDKIIYGHPCKPISHIIYARNNDVNKVVFDNEEELKKIKQYFPTAKLLLRIATDDSTSIVRLSKKFGALRANWFELIDLAYKMGLDVIGISFHIGSGCTNPNAFNKALSDARSIFDYAEKIGYKFSLLDIGGGFPGNENGVKFEEFVELINKDLKELFSLDEFPNIHVVAEPGTYFSSSAFTLVTNVTAKRKITNESKNKTSEQSFMYYINDGVFGAFCDVVFYPGANWHIPTLLKSRSPTEKTYSTIIWGPTCDSVDKVTENIQLPELEVSDWLVWYDFGAYTMVCSSGFNGFKITKIYYVISRKHIVDLQKLLSTDSHNGTELMLDFVENK